MRLSKKVLISTIAISSFQSNMIHAEEHELEPLIVTAAHIPLKADQVGSAFTVITSEDIEKRNAVFVTELLRDVPGFSVSQNGVVGSQTQVRVRGSEANHLLVLINGIEANDISGPDEFDFAHLMATDIERIEIIRGPQSALYGSDALAGVVNIITKKGSGPVSISAHAEGGSFGTVKGGAAINGSHNKINYNLNASYLDTNGSNIAKTNDEDDGYENTTVSFSAGYEFTDYLQVDVTGRHTEATSETDDQPFGSPFAVDADEETELSQSYLGAKAKLNLLNGLWQPILSAGITSNDRDNLKTGVEASSQKGKKLHFSFQNNIYMDTPDFANASHALTLAVDYEKDFFDQEDTEFGGLSNQERDSFTTGLIAGYNVDLLDSLFFSVSVRHDNNSDFKDATTYRMSAAYRLPELGTRLHASYGKGVKRPTFTERFGFFPGPFFFIGNPNLKPEESKGYDLGIEQRFWSDRAKIGLVYFHERLSDEIASRGFPSSPVNLTGTSKRQGVEINGQAKLTEGLSLSGTYTWLETTEVNPTTGLRQFEIRRPRNSASLNLDYVFFNDQANINLNISHTGTQSDLNFATFPANRVTLSSYTLINFAGSFQLSDQWDFYVKAENLLDEDYENVFGFQTQGVGAFAGFRFHIDP